MNRVIELKSLSDTLAFANEFANELKGNKHSVIFILFQGGLGSGKTTFTRELGKALGIKERITSPTFIGLNEYHTDELSLFHLDLYQTQQSYENFKELIDDSVKNIFIIEWSENMPENLISSLKHGSDFEIYNFEIQILSDEARTLSISCL